MNGMKDLGKIERVLDILPEEYVVILTTDHGGHDYNHGSTDKYDMTIPLFIFGEGISKGGEFNSYSILDVTPTVCSLLGVEINSSWSGNSLVN